MPPWQRSGRGTQVICPIAQRPSSAPYAPREARPLLGQVTYSGPNRCPSGAALLRPAKIGPSNILPIGWNKPINCATFLKRIQMSELDTLIEQTRGVTMNASDREKQRESFAFGNANIENSFVTRDVVKRAAEELSTNGRRR